MYNRYTYIYMYTYREICREICNTHTYNVYMYICGRGGEGAGPLRVQDGAPQQPSEKILSYSVYIYIYIHTISSSYDIVYYII